MLKAALFSDGTKEYRIPEEPECGEQVTIRFRTGAGDVDHVYAVVRDAVSREEGRRLELKKKESIGRFDFYETEILVGETPLRYDFEAVKGSEVCHYNRLGVLEAGGMDAPFVITPGFHVPEWAKGALMYQIFVDRFNNGDPTNDVLGDEYVYIGFPVTKVEKWDERLSVLDVDRFYGGDIQGIWDKLDYLQSLKVEVLYLSPVFVSPSNHKYDIQDYDYIDPHYGVIVEDGGDVLAADDRENAHATKYIKRVVNMKNLEASNAFFAKFVEEVHRRGMKVILDGVFNHCGSFNKWLDREKIYDKDESYEKGAFLQEDSPYHDFFYFYPDGSWPDNTHYDSWWGNDTLPKLNYEGSERLEQYIHGVARKWVASPYCIDGWRLDVAADLGHTPEYNHKFWKGFREAVKRENPEAIILAEHYGDPSAWLDGTQWDTVMNYDAFMEPISWFLTGMEKHSDARRSDLRGNAAAFFGSMTDYGARFTTPSALVAMNELSNHDHSRFLTRTNHVVGRTAFTGPQAANYGVNLAVMRQAVLMQMTWVGAPTIYYGDEAGVCGWTDPDNRRSYPWGKEDHELIRFHKEMIRIHKDYEVFSTGSLLYLHAENNLIGYGRFSEKEQAFVLVQVEGEECEVEVDVWRLGVANGSRMACMMYTCEEGFDMAARMCRVENGKVKVEIGKNGAVLWKTLSM